MTSSKLGSAGLGDRQARMRVIYRIQNSGQIWQEETSPDLYQEALAITWQEIFDKFSLNHSVLSIDLTTEWFNEHLKKNYEQLKILKMIADR